MTSHKAYTSHGSGPSGPGPGSAAQPGLRGPSVDALWTPHESWLRGGRASRELRLVEDVHRGEDVVLVGLDDTAVHDHLVQDEVRLVRGVGGLGGVRVFTAGVLGG